MTNGERLTPGRDINLALTVASDVGRVITAADTKIGFVLAAQGVLLAVTTQSLRGHWLVSMWHGTGVLAIVHISLAVVVLLLVGLWPRTGGTARWFAFTSFCDGGSVQSRPDLPGLADDAWAQVAALSAVARSKFRWFRAALVVGGIELAAVALWVTLGVGGASTS